MNWGGQRWTTLVWATIYQDPHLRAQLMVHELFHRVQPQLALLGEDGHNEHLDTLDGRYWIQLEWRALARALGSRGETRRRALSEALAFRAERRRIFPGSGENERRLEINEGLAQYTATVVTAVSLDDAEQDAMYQLLNAPLQETFIRTFPYAMGAAYGLLLDSSAPGWRQRVKVTDDLANMLAAASKVQPAEGPARIAGHYGGRELRLFEEKRDANQKEKLAELRRRFVDSPVLWLPPAKSSSFITNGMVPIPDVGVLYPKLRGSGDWGTIDATFVVVRNDDRKLILPAPTSVDPGYAAGDGWRLNLSPGWKVSNGPRSGDYQVAPAAANELGAIVQRIQRADYEGDRPALRRLYESLAPFRNDNDLASSAGYWRGFALWRRALNGFNESVLPGDIEEDLLSAVKEFESSLGPNPLAVEAKVAVLSCLSSLLFLNQNDPSRLRDLLQKILPLWREVAAAQPDNPRFLWVLGARQWYNPPERGGGEAIALATYQKGLQAARRHKATSDDALFPKWGEPELLMNLAWANLHRQEPDPDSAQRYAQQALALVPCWHYVRDILLPQIQEALRKQH